MTRRNVRNLVRHHTGQFGFFVGFQQHAGVHEEKSARQGEGVHFIGIDNFDSEGNLGVGVTHQVLAEPVHVLANRRIVQQLGLPPHFLGKLLAQSHLFLDGVNI